MDGTTRGIPAGEESCVVVSLEVCRNGPICAQFCGFAAGRRVCFPSNSNRRGRGGRGGYAEESFSRETPRLRRRTFDWTRELHPNSGKSSDNSRDVLRIPPGRAAAPQGGWDYWTGLITACNGDPRCVHNKRIDVSAAFFIELEFQQTGYVVYRMYRAGYGTIPNAPSRASLTYSQFIADRAQLVGGAGLPQSTIAFANTFVTRPEFKQAYQDSLPAATFVNQLFDRANLTGATNAPLRQKEIDGLTNGSKTRAQVLLDLIEINEFKTREYNPAFVLMQYYGYLRRDPDQAGYDFWLNTLNNKEPNNFRGMVCSFITSTEYQLRFGATITRSNHDCSQ
jgi:hypothetical protein